MELVQYNLLSPIVLAFVLGVIATLVRSDLRFPEPVYAALSIYLLFAIGLKGGAALAVAPMDTVWRAALATLVLGILTPFTAYGVLRRVGRFSIADSAAVAAHYGSVSAVTFIATLSFVEMVGAPAEAFMPTLVAILEVPAIIVALAIARAKLGGERSWREGMHEILAGRSVLLLLGGLAIGYLSGPPGLERVAPFFVAPFQGVLVLFLLEMGMVAAQRLRDLRKVGVFLAAFAIIVPILHGFLGVAAGQLAGLGIGGATTLGVMVGSASYIAAPAAVRISLPQANPSLYLTASLGITFPFNMTLGIPLQYAFARFLYGG